MKTYLTILLSFLVAPVLALAALDVTLSGSSVISVGGYSLVVSGSASIDSITVDTSSFSVVLSSGASLTVTSADRKAFSVSPSSLVTSQTCSATQSLLTVGTAGAVTTVTITPTSTNCTLSEGGIVGGGGGGGGGGGAPTPVYTVIPGTASSQSSSVGQGAIVTKTISTPSGVIIIITKTLKLGSQNSEVRALQQALAQDKTIYPEGLVTGYYGPATQRAIVRFQKKYGIEPVGFVGPLTRKKLNEVYGQTATSRAQQIQAIQTLINQLLEQIKVLQAQKAAQ